MHCLNSNITCYLDLKPITCCSDLHNDVVEKTDGQHPPVLIGHCPGDEPSSWSLGYLWGEAGPMCQCQAGTCNYHLIYTGLSLDKQLLTTC